MPKVVALDTDYHPEAQPPLAPLLTIEDVAIALNCSTKTVWRMLKHRELQGVKVLGAWRISRQVVSEFMAGR